MTIEYITGDATRPKRYEYMPSEPIIIAHVCNDQGGWGKGFVVELGERYPRAKHFYRHWARAGGDTFQLGRVQLVEVDTNLYVANMVAQHGYRATKKDGIPLRYEALRECLGTVCDHALRLKASVHMPRIGSGLAGGDWAKIEPIVIAELAGGVRTVIYRYKPKEKKR